MQLVKDAVKLAKGGRESINGPARPIQPEEAARGKLDMVTVKDWGSGDQDKLGELEVRRRCHSRCHSLVDSCTVCSQAGQA